MFKGMRRLDPLSRLYPRYELLPIELTNLLPFVDSLVEALQSFELCEYSPIELFDALKRLLTDRLLVISQEQAPEVLVQEEVARVERRLRHRQLLQVLTYHWVGRRVWEFKQKGCLVGWEVLLEVLGLGV
jgi:hypothetical protein